MSREGFDYGGVEPVSGGGGFKQPAEGQATARVKSIIHLGMYEKLWNKKKTQAAPYVAMIFELQGQFEDDGETPLTTSIAFPVKKGKKATMTKVLDAIDPKKEAKGFDECISLPASLKMEGSEEKDEDGKPKYVNCKEVSAVPMGMESMVPPLKEEGVGHVNFENLTEEAILELNPYLHVGMIMEKGVTYEGSKAQELLAKIRKEDPDYGKTSDKEEKSEEKKPDEKPEPDMSENEEF